MSGSPSSTSDLAAADSSNQRRLRLWPGLVVVALMWAVRWSAPLWAVNGKQFFLAYMITPLVALGLTALWWVFASRIRWSDRFLVLGAIVVAAGATIAPPNRPFP